MFVDALTQHLEVPGEPGEWMDLRPLSFLEIDEARVQGYIGMMETVGQMAPVQDQIQRIFTAAEAAKKRTAEAAAGEESEEESSDPEADAALMAADDDPLEGLDLTTVLKAGIVKWSYDRPVDEANISLLDEDTATWAAKAIVGIRSKESLGNSSAPSTTL